MLKDKVVVISGASSGIGRAAAYACRKEGARLTLHHIDTADARRDVEAMLADFEGVDVEGDAGSVAVAVAGDIVLPETSARVVERTVAHFGRVDVLVSCAGICAFSDLFDVTVDLLESHTAVNYHGTFHLVQACARAMARQVPPGGSIVSISSISALVGGGRQVHYTPTKAALLSLMQSCAVALGPYGIRCNAVLPGTIQTGLNEEDLRDEGKRTYMASRCALGRLGVPEDVAGPIVFLASDMSAYVTGAQLLVDGGLFVNLQ